MSAGHSFLPPDIGLSPPQDRANVRRLGEDGHIDFIANLFAGLWAAGVLAALWYVWRRRRSPPPAESKEDRDLRDWLDGQM